MAGISNFAIVESPITSGKLMTAMDLTKSALAVSGVPIMASFNQGRSIIVGYTDLN